MNNIVLILSDARGTYIPRDFLADDYNEIAHEHCAKWELTEENKEHWIDATNPDSEFYWESWDWILSNAKFKDESGKVYTLHQDGDLWGVAWDSLNDEEYEEFTGETR